MSSQRSTSHASSPAVHPVLTATSAPKFTYVGDTTPAQPYSYTAITFAPGVSFSQALRFVTDLGLQPVPWCLGAVQGAGAWQSADEKSSFDSQTGGTLGVFTTSESPPDWSFRLARLPQVISALNGMPHCALIPYVPPSATAGSYLGIEGVYSAVQVQFASSVGYDQALESMLALGFRLGSPCPLPLNASMADPAGQETAFTTTHLLRINTSFANSSLWRDQLAHTAGVLSEQDGAAALCL